MSQSQRPYNRAKPDKNHNIVPKAYKNWGGGFSQNEFGVWRGHIRGIQVEAHDTNKLGGEIGDWLVWVSWLPIVFEVKMPRPKVNPETAKHGVKKLNDNEYLWRQLKPGERSFFLHSSAIKFIVTIEEEVWAHTIAAVEFVQYVDDIPFKGKPFLNLFFPKLQKESLYEQFERSLQFDDGSN